MIQANELRVGNWIKDRGGKMWQIDCWESHDKVASKPPYLGVLNEIPMFGHPYTEEIPYLQPVDLTIQLLINSGFRQIDKYTFVKKNIFIHHRKSGFKYGKLIVSSMHQLQNLYFALTQKEL
jgi:hypothetical protein